MRKDFYGIVEDRNDPLKIGRVRVRVHGIHTDDKQKIATPDLPWAQVLLPTTSAGLSGFGTQHGLIEGSSVYGFFRDGDTCQDPVVVASAVGYPSGGYFETVSDELLTRTPDRGFNDPRKLTVDAYTDTPDGPTPPHDSRRTQGLTLALDTAPKSPETLEILYDDPETGSTITEYEITEEDLPWYPLYTDDSDLSSLARGETIDKNINETLEPLITSEFKITVPDSPAAPVYPYNKVTQTESGHIFEVDDTVGAERISTYHRSGTFEEIHPDGSRVQRIVNDNYQVICKGNRLYIAGDYDIIVEKGNVNIHVNTGNVNTTVLKGNVDTKVMEGNVDLYVKGNVTETIDGNISQTVGGDVTQDITGSVTQTVGGDVTQTISKNLTSKVTEKIDIQGKSVSIKATSGTMNLESTGVNTIKGSKVNIN